MSIPLSALRGDNVTEASPNTPWYSGPTLMEYLEAVEVDDDTDTQPFRFVVQWVNRPNLDFRGFSGVIVGGTVRTGDRVRVVPSGVESTVSRIVTYDGDLEEAVAGESVTLCLADEVDVSRGDVIAAATAPPSVADQFETHVVWMSEDEMLPGRRYLVKIGGPTVGATVDQPKYQVNVNTLEHMAAKTLELNEIGVCNLNLEQAVPFDPYTDNRDMGGFILIDRHDQQHRRRRAHPLRAPPGRQRALAGHRGGRDRARHAQGPTPCRGVVHRTLRRRQVDHRQHRRAQAARGRPAHLPARR